MAIPAGLTRWSFHGTLDGGEIWQTSVWQNGRDASEVAGTVASDLVNNSAFTPVKTQILAMLGPGDTFQGLNMYHYGGGSGADAQSSGTNAGNGTGTVDHPAQICAVLTLKTAVAGRSGRGRMYWPATGVPMIAGNQMTHSNIDNMVDFLAQYFTDSTSAGFPFVVLSQKLGTSASITSVEADYIADTQRRRRNKLTSTRHSTDV